MSTLKNIGWVLVALLGPPLFLYGCTMFATWGDGWNPGDWEESSRGLVAVLWAIWVLMVGYAWLETH